MGVYFSEAEGGLINSADKIQMLQISENGVDVTGYDNNTAKIDLNDIEELTLIKDKRGQIISISFSANNKTYEIINDIEAEEILKDLKDRLSVYVKVKTETREETTGDYVVSIILCCVPIIAAAIILWFMVFA